MDIQRKRTSGAAWALLGAVVASLALAGCNGRDSRDTAAEVRRDAREANTQARQERRAAEDQARGQSREAGSDVRGAVMGAASETRQATARLGDKLDDMQITTRVNAGLAADKELSAMKVDVDTKDGVVTLMGTAPNAASKARAAEIARGVKDVQSVNNQLSITG